jgi:glucokinase
MASPGDVLIGVDVGGGTMSGGLVTPGGDVVSVIQTGTHDEGPGTALDTLLRIIDTLVARARKQGQSIAGIGVGLPGIVDADAGVLWKGIGRVDELTEFPLAQLLETKTGIPAFIDNDVNALALGEWRYGLGRGVSSLVVLALGTGLGGAIVLDGRLHRGKSGSGGEFGHVPVSFDGRLCVCGARGCLGAYAAGYGIAAEWQRRTGQPDSGAAPNAEAVFRAAENGSAIAREVIEDTRHALSAALGGIVNALDPEVIVVTGGIVKGLVPWQPEILSQAGRHALAGAFAATRIHLVPVDKSQTVRGGAALVLYEQARRAGRP